MVEPDDSVLGDLWLDCSTYDDNDDNGCAINSQYWRDQWADSVKSGSSIFDDEDSDSTATEFTPRQLFYRKVMKLFTTRSNLDYMASNLNFVEVYPGNYTTTGVPADKRAKAPRVPTGDVSVKTRTAYDEDYVMYVLLDNMVSSKDCFKKVFSNFWLFVSG